jgi:hypothetical protein
VAGLGDELSEFQALSRKVSDKTATDEERMRWRELRSLLVKPLAPAESSSVVARRELRHTRKLKVELAPVEAMHATFSDDVSSRGVRVRVSTMLHEGAAVVMRLELDEPMTVTARVAWCKRDGGHFVAGLEFEGLRAEERERLEAWLHAR